MGCVVEQTRWKGALRKHLEATKLPGRMGKMSAISVILEKGCLPNLAEGAMVNYGGIQGGEFPLIDMMAAPMYEHLMDGYLPADLSTPWLNSEASSRNSFCITETKQALDWLGN